MHTRTVEYLAVCLHLWLAISYSAITTKDVQTCEGNTESFSWHNDNQNLRKVQYYFKNNYIATSSSRVNSSSVKFIDETMKYRLRVTADDNVAFQIDNVTTEDSGEYKIILTYTNGDTTDLIGRLDVKENVLGNFNITCENDTETGVCTCGNNTGSDLYTWVGESPEGVITEKTTNESKLDLRDFPKGCSVFCKRRSDCKKSNAFDIPSDSSSQTKPVSCCQGGTASFPWTDEIPPFRSIEWYFENTQLAETSESSFSQESLIINEIYKNRFHLHQPGNAGFNLTKVVKTDEGNYRCIITLQSTGLEFDWKLRVEGVTGRRRKRATSGVDEPFSCDEDEQPPASDADEQPPASDSSTDATIGIVVAACIVVIAVVVVIVIKRKRNSRTEQGSAGPDGNCLEETGPESHKLVVHEDQTRQPEGASPDSHEPIKQVDKTHQPDKQTCEQMNLTQTC